MNSKVLFILGSLLFMIGSLQAQDDQLEILSKDEAFGTMLENNFGIQFAINQVAIADNNRSILNSDYLPSLTAVAGADFDQTSSTTNFNGALDNQGNPRPEITIDNAETKRYSGSLNLDYTLFDGLGRMYNFKRLKEEYNLSQLQAREAIELTTLQLFIVYFEVARLTENVSVLEEALRISKERELRARYQFEYGQNNKLNVLNAEVDVVTDSINVLNTQQLLNNTKRDLNIILNRELNTVVEVDTTITFLEPIQLVGYFDGVEENNVTLLQAEQDILISDYSIKSARSLLLPTIGLTGSYGWNRNENPASAFFPGTTNKSNSLALGANLRWNLFDGGSSLTAVKNAKIFFENQQLVKEQIKQEVFRDIANARGDYLNALKVFRMQEKNVITNDDNFQRSQERLKLGQITNVEFRQAQLNLLNALTTKNAAKYTAKIAEYDLLQLMGQLLNLDF